MARIEVQDSFPRYCGAESLLMNAQKDSYDLASIPAEETETRVNVIGYDEAEIVIDTLRELRADKGCACMEGTEVILNCQHLLEALRKLTDEN